MSRLLVHSLDLRGLEPPEPMTRIIEALATLPAGTQIEARLERRPMFLLEELKRRDQNHTCEPHPEGGWRLTVPIAAAP